MGRSGFPCRGPIAGREDVSETGRRPFPKPDLHQRSDHGPNHLLQKPVGVGFDPDQVRLRVDRQVPEVADGPYAGATVRHLIDMRAGVVLMPQDQAAYNAATGWDPTQPGETEGLHAFFAGLKGPPARHGGPFRYVSPNTDLVGWAIERAASQIRGLPNVWYDTSTVCDSDALDALYTGVGVDRVMYGSDDMIGPMRGKYITFGRAWAYLSPTNHAMSLAHCDPRMTYVRYEQLRAMKRGARQIGLSTAQREALFYGTARALVDSVKLPA